MKVLVDTSVWSAALRRKAINDEERAVVAKLQELIESLQVVVIGPVRQEILSGIADDKQFELLKTRLAAFEDLLVATGDYEKAAFFYNICRVNGIQGSHVDFLICAVAANHKLPIFTLDKDFYRYAEYLPITVYSGGS
jgi:predicted nucleic acid-binding protein